MTTTVNQKYSKGFTLIELLVVIAIIGVLASVTLASLSSTREKANIAKAAQDLRGISNNLALYLSHTGTYPAECTAECNSTDDPFINSLGVKGWKGPYTAIWDRTHPWGGGYGMRAYDTYRDGSIEIIIYLDDDRPNTSSTDDQGQIPIEALIAIDEILDDGDLSTGKFVGDERDSMGSGGAALSAPGEGIWTLSI